MDGILSKRQRISFLLLSLLIHTALLTTLFVSLSDPHAQKVFAQEKRAALVKALQELPQKKSRWVATKARASQFGVPVVFDDEPPQPSSQQTPQLASSMQPPAQATQESMQKQAESISDNTLEQKVKEVDEGFTLKPLTITDQQPTQNTLTADQKKQTTKNTAATMATKQAMQGNSSQSPSQEAGGSGGIKKPITLAQIAKGFTENLKNKGTHSVTMRGESHGIPTDEQLKYERYLQRLQWCIQNSMKIHQREYQIPVPPKTSLDIHIGIDRTGKLAELVLVRSSGISDLDDFILFAFKDASSSFPPIPAFFKEKLFTVLFVVKCIEAEQPGFRFFMQ